MSRQHHRVTLTRALCATAIAFGVGAMITGCTSGERAERMRAIAALQSQIDEIRKSQEADGKALTRLAGEMKALDAQSAFVVGEVKASSEERARVKASLEETDKALRDVQGAVDKLSKAVTASPASTPAAAANPSAVGPDGSPEPLYEKAMASVMAEQHAQAVVEFRELVTRFPGHPLASNAQYWIGEAYYRQRDYPAALNEFRKVMESYPTSSQVPEALLKIGLCYRALNDQEHARVAWEQIVKDFPGTNAASQARSLLATPGGTATTP